MDEPKVLRDEKGLWLPGSVPNPGGRPSVPWTPYKDRAAILMEKYTRAQILDIVENEKYDDVSTGDAIALEHLARVLKAELTRTTNGSDDMRAERKELLDRIEGQSKATTELTGKDGAALFEKLDDAELSAQLESALKESK